MTSTLHEDVADFVAREIAAGFADPEDVVESTVEAHADQAGTEDLRPLIERLVAAAVQVHLAAQQTWPEETDCDRLDNALNELTTAGIVCRQNFLCCSTCGEAAIGAEMDEEAKDGLEVRGYAFYHCQDTDRGVAGHGVYLKYGAVEEGEEPLLRIGHEIADTLRRHGLEVEWSGDGNDAILVRLDWKRRR
jgi:hypothetical protein